MIQWPEDIKIYLHREPVDFRKAINGLSVIVQDEMALSPFDRALFVFCNKKRSQLKVLYWDETGFALWKKAWSATSSSGPSVGRTIPWCWIMSSGNGYCEASISRN